MSKISAISGSIKAAPGVEVVHASLHQAVTWAGCIGSEVTLSAKKVPGLKMYWTPQGLLCEMKGGKALIPTANIAIALLAEEAVS